MCTYSFILHRAGLLSGRRATAHWAVLQKLRDMGDIEVTEDWIVHEGKIWTSAGVSTGIDLALALIECVSGEHTAGRVQFAAE